MGDTRFFNSIQAGRTRGREYMGWIGWDGQNSITENSCTAPPLPHPHAHQMTSLSLAKAVATTLLVPPMEGISLRVSFSQPETPIRSKQPIGVPAIAMVTASFPPSSHGAHHSIASLGQGRRYLKGRIPATVYYDQHCRPLLSQDEPSTTVRIVHKLQ